MTSQQTSLDKQPEPAPIPSGVFPATAVFTLLTTIPVSDFEEACEIAYHYLGYRLPKGVPKLLNHIDIEGRKASDIMLIAKSKMVASAPSHLAAFLDKLHVQFRDEMTYIEERYPSTEHTMASSHPRQRMVHAAIGRLKKVITSECAPRLFVKPRVIEHDPCQSYSDADYRDRS